MITVNAHLDNAIKISEDKIRDSNSIVEAIQSVVEAVNNQETKTATIRLEHLINWTRHFPRKWLDIHRHIQRAYRLLGDTVSSMLEQTYCPRCGHDTVIADDSDGINRHIECCKRYAICANCDRPHDNIAISCLCGKFKPS